MLPSLLKVSKVIGPEQIVLLAEQPAIASCGQVGQHLQLHRTLSEISDYRLEVLNHTPVQIFRCLGSPVVIAGTNRPIRAVSHPTDSIAVW